MKNTIHDFKNLTPEQKVVLERFNTEEAFFDHFYFTGGTLLKAIGLVPRQSNDLDFFTFPEVKEGDYPRLMAKLRDILWETLGKRNLKPIEKGFLHEPSQMLIEFIADRFPSLDAFVPFGNISTSSLQDLGANKASALCCRDEVKDMIDIAFLTHDQGWKLSHLASFAEKKFQLGTVTLEKLFEELNAKKKMFPIKKEYFFENPSKNAELVTKQVDKLLSSADL